MSEQLLRIIEAGNGQFVSGQAISQQLGTSRTAVWKQIRKLEAAGYKFEASRRLGYRLVEKPEKLTLQALQAQLQTRRMAQIVQLLDTVDSTQNVAQQLAADGAPEGTLVLAEKQLNGRGRLGRSWNSPGSRGVWMSLVLRPPVSLPFAPQLTLLTAVALCRSLRVLTGLDIGIKWPNDLLVEGRKISGILLESAAEEDRLLYVIAGIGISVNLDEADYPPEMRKSAISLKLAAGHPFDRVQVIAAFLLELEQLYELYLAEGFAPIGSLWEALSVSLGKEVTLLTPQGIRSGTAIGLAEQGALLLQQADGTTLPIYSAEMGQASD